MSTEKLINYEIHGVLFAQSLDNPIEWFCRVPEQDDNFKYLLVQKTPTSFLTGLYSSDFFKYFPASFVKTVMEEVKRRNNPELPKTEKVSQGQMESNEPLFIIGDYVFSKGFFDGWRVSSKERLSWTPLVCLDPRGIAVVQKALMDNPVAIIPSDLEQTIKFLVMQYQEFSKWRYEQNKKDYVDFSQDSSKHAQAPHFVKETKVSLGGYIFQCLNGINWHFLQPNSKSLGGLELLSLKEIDLLLDFISNNSSNVPPDLTQELKFHSIIKQYSVHQAKEAANPVEVKPEPRKRIHCSSEPS